MPESLRTNSAAVATAHPLATDAARQILRSGGNAVDAAVAALATIGVVLSHQCGFGGYGGSLVLRHAGSGRCAAVDFDSRAPLGFRDELFAGDSFNQSNYGYLAVTVPGVVAGLSFALREFGTLSWARVTEPAIAAAESGIDVDSDTARHLERWRAGADAVSLRAHFPEGRIPQIGERWVQRDLAGLLRTLADEGPQALYEGDIAHRIVRQIREHGGILSEQDFSSYRAARVEPLTIDYRGHALYTPPPPSGGVTMLQLLKTLEQFDLAAVRPWSADYFHLVVEAAKQCWAERAKCLGDPDFVKMPLDEMLSTASAAARASAIRRDAAAVASAAGAVGLGPDTSNVSVIDAAGNIVSLTATQGYIFGSRVVIDGLGLVMGHGMSRFDFVPGHPNRPEPGKRMHHNMSPTIATRGSQPFAAIGMPGGPKIITVTAQLLASLIDFAATPRQAIDAPRVHTEGREPVGISAWADESITRGLGALGHTLELGQSVGGPPGEIGGHANVVTRDARGDLHAASGAGDAASAVI